MSIERNVFSTRDRLAQALADAVVDNLNAGLDERGAAALAVSGGSTPKQFFQTLAARQDVDWENVTITLVDERWVHESSDRSNAGLVKDNLLAGPAAQAVFVPLYSGGDEPDAGAIARTNERFGQVPMPFDAVILGMGNDGHTASFFPGGDTLSEALTAQGPALAIRAPGAGEPRITFTLPRLLRTDGLYLHIEGEEKADVLDTALGDGPVADMPIRAVLRSGHAVTVYWCP